MNHIAPNIYKLLPSFYKLRDAEQGLALKALSEVINVEVAILQKNIDQLYDNWFVETCEPWVVPYLGQLVGIEPESSASFISEINPRSAIGDSIRFRQRRGTLPVLEEVANDLGFPAFAVEFEKRCLQTQLAGQARANIGRLIDFMSEEDVDASKKPGIPFRTFTVLPDFREPSSLEPIGWYHPDRIGVFVWRRRSLPLLRVKPKCIGSCKVGKGKRKRVLCIYSFDPSGSERQLFVKPVDEESAFATASQANLPIPLTVSMLEHGFDALTPDDEDSDGDGLDDWLEDVIETDPMDPDTDKGGRIDGKELEQEHGTNPWNKYDDIQHKFYGFGRSVCIFQKRSREFEIVPAHEVVARDLTKLTNTHGCGCESACRCQKECDRFAAKLVDEISGHKYSQLVKPKEKAGNRNRKSRQKKFYTNFAVDPFNGLFAFVVEAGSDGSATNDFLVSFHESRQLAIGGGQYKRKRKRLHRFKDEFPELVKLKPNDTLKDLLNDPDHKTVAGVAEASGSIRTLLNSGKSSYVDPPESNRQMPSKEKPGAIELVGDLTLDVFSADLDDIEIEDFVEVRAAEGSRPFFESQAGQCSSGGQIKLRKGSTLILDGLVFANQLTFNVLEDEAQGETDSKGGIGFRPENSCEDNQLDNSGLETSEAQKKNGKTHLIIRHCTIGELSTGCGSPDGKFLKGLMICGGIDVLTIEDSIVGPIEVPTNEANTRTHLILRDSIVGGKYDHDESDNVASLDGADALQVELMERSTILGTTNVFRIRKAVDSIFNGSLKVQRQVHSDLTKTLDQFRFCYLRPDVWEAEGDQVKPVYKTVLPDRHRCQPELAFTRSQHEHCPPGKVEFPLITPTTPVDPRSIYPIFVNANDPNHQGFGQLDLETANEILAGSEEGSEMGVFAKSYFTNRFKRLKSRLETDFQPLGKRIIVINADSLE